RIKSEEKAGKDPDKQAEQPAGALSGIPVGLPALTRALKLQQKAGRVGFDWNDPGAVLDKIREETKEVAQAIAEGDTAHATEEVGDLLFVVVNLARHLGADPERALRETNLKFERRFGAIERALAAQGKTPEQATLAEMDALWDEAKRAERSEVVISSGGQSS
ncbi:MAG: MazG nucleotide pyrophosphohydrolase domain-containing protein, partial [Rhodoplanes sp.]